MLGFAAASGAAAAGCMAVNQLYMNADAGYSKLLVPLSVFVRRCLCLHVFHCCGVQHCWLYAGLLASSASSCHAELGRLVLFPRGLEL